MKVTAKDVESGNDQSVKIIFSGGLSDNDIDKHKKAAQINWASDRKKAENLKHE